MRQMSFVLKSYQRDQRTTLGRFCLVFNRQLILTCPAVCCSESACVICLPTLITLSNSCQADWIRAKMRIRLISEHSLLAFHWVLFCEIELRATRVTYGSMWAKLYRYDAR